MSERAADGFEPFIDAWVAWVAPLSFAAMVASGASPWANVATGAAGNAYALAQLGARRHGADRDALLAAARRWSQRAHRIADRPDALRVSPGHRVGGSTWFGRPGLHLVAALVARAIGRPRELERAIGALVAAGARARAAEVATGQAGLLTASLALHRGTGDPRALALAARLADRLLEQRARWPRDPSFAHGRAGVHHALFTWAKRSGSGLPDDLVAARPPTTEAIRAGSRAGFEWSQCNGVAGFVQTWVAAYELTHDRRWLVAARAAATELAATEHFLSGGLCCGVTGHAYALLAVARIDPAGPHRAAAAALARRALGDARLAHGLLFGMAGVACLAADLAAAGPAFTPLIGG